MVSRLQESFHAVYRLLERPRIARRVVAALLFVHTLLLGYSAYVHSPTLNEPGHLVAGLSHWKFGRFELFRVNPPLVRMVAALPVMAVGYHEDWSGFYEGPGARPEMTMGEKFVAANGERSFFLFMIARWACIPFSWIGAIVCFLWARDLYGRPAGVMACAIWCFEPNILAHASLITADAGATALGVAACYTFWRWLKRPTWLQAAITGIVLGLAELAKTTLIVFYPLWPLMWVIYRLAPTWSSFSETRTRVSERRGYVLLREAGMLAVRMFVGLYVLNLGYGFEGTFTKLKEFECVSDLFTGSTSIGTPSPQSPAPSPQQTNRFAGTWLGELPAPFPKNYLLGIDLQQKDFEHYSEKSYLRGDWSDHGWWYYYLYACAIKVPLGLWLLGFFAFLARIFLSLRERLGEVPSFIPRPYGERPGEGSWFIPRPYGERSGEGHSTADSRQPTASGRDEFILLFPAIVIFAVVSSKTGFSEHMRYVLPAFPFFFIAASQIFSLGCLTPSTAGVNCGLPGAGWRFPRVPLFSTSLVGILSCWLFTSSFAIYPHSLSYFNESIGGPRNGAMHLLGSNVDWGQDLRYAQSQLEGLNSQTDKRRLFLAYVGACNPYDLGLRGFVSWNSLNADTAVAKQLTDYRNTRCTILCCVSLNLLQRYPRFAYDGTGAILQECNFPFFESRSPNTYLGYSMLCFVKEYRDLELLNRRAFP